MFIRHYPRNGWAYELQCEVCGESVAFATQAEFKALLTGEFGRVLCFECEGRADEIPAILLADEVPYWLRLGKEGGEESIDTFVLIDPFRQARQNQERIDMWARSFREFVQDLQRSEEDE